MPSRNKPAKQHADTYRSSTRPTEKNSKNTFNNSPKPLQKTKDFTYSEKNVELEKISAHSIETKNRLLEIEKTMINMLKSAQQHGEELEQHREEITIFQSQTTILEHLAKTFDNFTQSLRFLTVTAVIGTVIVGAAVYVAWQDYRNTPSSLSIIGRESEIPTGNAEKNRDLCNDMQQKAITNTKARAGELAKQVGGTEIINTEVLILSDCVEQIQFISNSTSNQLVSGNGQPGVMGVPAQNNQNQLTTTVQVTVQYR